jgi:redox-sensitive bicupin YhaK (pirin superfamily)
MAPPYFTMFWNEQIQRERFADAQGRGTEVVCIAGSIGHARGLPPPPDSWASTPGADLAILTLRMEPGARWTLPAAAGRGTRRQLYFFKGSALTAGGTQAPPYSAIELRADQDVELTNGPQDVAELLLLQGRPIGEPVAQYGPFVMNTQAEIHPAFADDRATQFGGWPWGAPDPVHPREQGRFARHADGRVEQR